MIKLPTQTELELLRGKYFISMMQFGTDSRVAFVWSSAKALQSRCDHFVQCGYPNPVEEIERKDLVDQFHLNPRKVWGWIDDLRTSLRPES